MAPQILVQVGALLSRVAGHRPLPIRPLGRNDKRLTDRRQGQGKDEEEG